MKYTDDKNFINGTILLRKRYGLNIAALARCVGVQRSTLSAIENGRRDLAKAHMDAIAEYFIGIDDDINGYDDIIELGLTSNSMEVEDLDDARSKKKLITLAEHANEIKKFSDHEKALKINRLLVEIEKWAPNGLEKMLRIVEAEHDELKKNREAKPISSKKAKA